MNQRILSILLSLTMMFTLVPTAWAENNGITTEEELRTAIENATGEKNTIATVYKGNIIKNLIMDCQSYTKYRPNETTGGIFVSWRRKEELPTGA